MRLFWLASRLHIPEGMSCTYNYTIAKILPFEFIQLYVFVKILTLRPKILAQSDFKMALTTEVNGRAHA